MAEALRIIKMAFRAHASGKTQMPAKIYLKLRQYNGDLRAMPAFLENNRACGIKWVSVFPDNRKYGLPTIQAIIILNDAKTGFPLAIMDGTYITRIRTGAAGGIAAKYLAKRDSRIIALVGCGIQAQAQLEAINQYFDISLVKVWGYQKHQAAGFIREMADFSSKMEISYNIKDCLKDADIVVTTTPSRKPIVFKNWLKEGAHINAIGADAKGKQELDPKILRKAKIVIDDWAQAPASGEINVPWAKGLIGRKNIYATLGELILQRRKARAPTKEITIFDSTGLAIQDISIAQFIYQKALKMGIGKRLTLMA